jgi:tetratricopeptide (TPR) repeat protein
VITLIEGQLPQLYKGANFFGAAQSVPAATHHAQSITRLLDTTDGSTRQSLLRIGSRVAEFLGWLHQDLGDFRAASYWSDRSMEWAQEAADDHMQSYVLFRKSHQATARANAQQAVGLSRAAQRIQNLTPTIKALAIQQEAVAYALQHNPRAALTKFDEAHEFASASTENSAESTLDTSYCTPTYIEIQRANCWIDLGEPKRAIRLFEDELKSLPQVYRNDRGVYLARLARAYVAAHEHDRGAEAASKALAIVAQTGSARTFAELASVASAIEARRGSAETAFAERYEAVRRQLTTGPDRRRQGR